MQPVRLAAACAAGLILSAAAPAQEVPGARTELRRADLAGAPGMEVVASISEYKPGAEVARHSHHGIESGYVLQGAMIQTPGKEPVMLAAGTPIFNLRDVPHAGYRVVGEQSLKFYTVHVVDKDKPLYEYVK